MVGGAEEGKGVKYVVMGGQAVGGEHTMQYTHDVYRIAHLKLLSSYQCHPNKFNEIE